MSGLMDLLTQQLGGSVMEQMGQKLGANPQATQAAMGAALPAILAGLAKNAQSNDGAQALSEALERDHDGSVLNDALGAINAPNESAGNGILGHVLGGRRSAVETGVAQASGLNPAQAASMMTMLAPMVMGALGRQKREQSMDAGGLASMLSGERQSLEQKGAGGFMRLLDADGDGNVADDLMKHGKNILGGLFGRR